MNAKKLIAAVAMIAAAGSVFAADNTEFVEFTHVQPVKTRAEVRAELHRQLAAATADIDGKAGVGRGLCEEGGQCGRVLRAESGVVLSAGLEPVGGVITSFNGHAFSSGLVPWPRQALRKSMPLQRLHRVLRERATKRRRFALPARG